MVIGLVWIVVGGEILFVEISLSCGKGGCFILIGNLGEVMKEFVMLVFEYIKVYVLFLNLDEEIFDNWNIYVYVFEGVILKDGLLVGIIMVILLVFVLI